SREAGRGTGDSSVPRPPPPCHKYDAPSWFRCHGSVDAGLSSPCSAPVERRRTSRRSCTGGRAPVCGGRRFDKETPGSELSFGAPGKPRRRLSRTQPNGEEQRQTSPDEAGLTVGGGPCLSRPQPSPLKRRPHKLGVAAGARRFQPPSCLPGGPPTGGA